MFKLNALLPIAALFLVQSLHAALPTKDLRPGMTFVQVSESKEHPLYWIQQHEATRKHWRAIMKTEPWKVYDSRPEDNTIPVTFVSWRDVQEYVRKLNDVDFDFVYRLPTEREWMEACSAGASQEPANLGNVAWYHENAYLVPGQNFTHPVAQKAPNAWGLYDCLGNVWEWVQDPGRNEQERMQKGGSWRCTKDIVTASERNYMDAEEHAGDLGFRLVAILVGDDLWSDWQSVEQGGMHLAWRVRRLESGRDGQATWCLNIRNREEKPVEVVFCWGLGATTRHETMVLNSGQTREVNAALMRTKKGQRPTVTLETSRPSKH